MKDAAQLFGAPSPEAAKFSIDIFNFEKRIAEITPDNKYMTDPIKVNNKMKVSKENYVFVNKFYIFGKIRSLSFIFQFPAETRNH